MNTGCGRILTKEWASKVHDMMVKLCGRCTCEDPETVEALFVETPVRELRDTDSKV